MTENQGSNGVPPMFSDERMVEWMDEHMMELKKSVSGQSLLVVSLSISFAFGLAAHIGGYFLLLSVPSGLLGLLADLLHALGWSLWTGVVVAIFVQVFPEAKRRQIQQVIDTYEALRRKKTQSSQNLE